MGKNIISRVAQRPKKDFFLLDFPIEKKISQILENPLKSFDWKLDKRGFFLLSRIERCSQKWTRRRKFFIQCCKNFDSPGKIQWLQLCTLYSCSFMIRTLPQSLRQETLGRLRGHAFFFFVVLACTSQYYSQYQMGSIKIFKSQSPFLQPVLLISLSNSDNIFL